MSTSTKSVQELGRKVYLRSPSNQDRSELIALNRASVQFHRRLVAPPRTDEEYFAFLSRAEKDDSACFLICRQTDKAIVGTINLSQIFRGGFQSAYVGYYVGSTYAGHGYMTEALQLMLRFAFKTLKLHRLEANIQPGNTASIALVRRAGFTQEGYSKHYLKIGGRWRDHERWAIMAEDWKSKK